MLVSAHMNSYCTFQQSFRLPLELALRFVCRRLEATLPLPAFESLQLHYRLSQVALKMIILYLGTHICNVPLDGVSLSLQQSQFSLRPLHICECVQCNNVDSE